MERTGIVSGVIWWKELEDSKKLGLIYKLISSEIERGELTQLIMSRIGKLPDKMIKHYLSVIARIKCNELQWPDAPDAKLKRFPRYNTMTNELQCNALSAMLLLNHCYPAQKKTKHDDDMFII